MFTHFPFEDCSKLLLPRFDYPRQRSCLTTAHTPQCDKSVNLLGKIKAFFEKTSLDYESGVQCILGEVDLGNNSRATVPFKKK
jgi:hypothetical protein